MTKACSVIVAALEDYGLVPVEANASGTPVIAYGAGGVLDRYLVKQEFFQTSRRRMHSNLHSLMLVKLHGTTEKYVIML